MPLQVAARFRDKSLQKDALREMGIDTAEFVVINDLGELAEDFSFTFGGAVLKPVAGGATKETSVIRSDADLQAAAKRAREEPWSQRRTRTFILEEFISGEEWHADGSLNAIAIPAALEPGFCDFYGA